MEKVLEDLAKNDVIDLVLQNKDGKACRSASPSAFQIALLMNFSEVIKDLRKKNKVTQKQAAAHLGISERKYQYLESGDNEITMKEFLSLMELYNHALYIEPLVEKLRINKK